jgi:thiopeptide-type bacteriocin biosynthesis protein
MSAMPTTLPGEDLETPEMAVLRTPLLPMEEIEAWSADLLSPDSTGEEDALREALAHDRALLRRRLQALIDRPEIREALFLASPDLTESLAQWRKDPDGKKGQRTEHGLVRYFLRMASRPTPFGLFSGCTPGGIGGGIGQAGEPTRLALAERGTYRRHGRLDMDYLFALCEHLGQNPELRREILFRPNSSLYAVSGRLRYAEARVAARRLRTYHLVAVDSFDILEQVIERAADGARLAELAAFVVAADPDQEITPEDAVAFLQDLVDNQILVPELALPVTGEESTPGLLRQIEGLPSAAEAAERLARAERELAAIDAQSLGTDPERYRAIARDLEPLGVTVEMSRLFQVDMVKPAREVRIGHGVLKEIRGGIDLLYRLYDHRGEGALDDFRNAFRDRYGEGREVPLLAALDEESGIGFERAAGAAAEAAPLLDGLPFRPRTERTTAPWSSREATLMRLAAEAFTRGRMEVVLTKEDIDRLAPAGDKPALPDAFHAMIAVAASSPEALEQGDFRLLFEHAVGPSGARILGRFCHTDEQIRSGVEAHLAAEEAHRPDAVFAEVVHLPAGRIGNILARPVLRSHEIIFLGRSGAPAERQIPVDDLTVTVDGSRIFLRSRRLGREILPRLTTAHNTARESLGVYRFLAALQGQGRARALQWDWGVLEAAPFLPRVSFGKLVLARARWNLVKEELQPLAAVSGGVGGAARYRLAQAWREERRMPRYVALVDGDNELLLDFHNPLSLDAVVELVKNREQAVFKELYPPPEELCAHGPEGRFFHEIVVPFVRRRPAEPSVAATAPAVVAAPVARSFPPGSEWLYAKIYSGTATADRVLCEEIAPLAREAVAAGHARSWFFIRYGDPDWHLRVRFRGEPDVLRREVLPRLKDAFRRLLASGAAWKLQLDTYEREIERYGGPQGIELSEQLFARDSEAVAAILESLASDSGADLRWRLALLGVDRLMDDFGCDLEARRSLAERGRANFAGRFKYDLLRAPIADRLRKERGALERLLSLRDDGPGEIPQDIQPALRALRKRSGDQAPIVEELYDRERRGRLQPPVREILLSYIHMFVNRLSRAAGPEHELVLYDFLAQIYNSLLARARKGESRTVAAGG